MRTPLRMLGLLLLAILAGCAAPAEKKTAVQVIPPPYQPQRIYPLNYDQAWDATLKALEEDQIPLQSANKEAGLIRTDYQAAPKGARYRFHIQLSRMGPEKTALRVRCFFEQKDEKGEYRDFTYSSPRQVAQMEDGVYRRIESAFLVAESKKETVPPPPPPSPPAPPPAAPSASPEAPLAPPPPPPARPEAPVAPPPLVVTTLLITQKTGLLMAEPSSEGHILTALKKGVEVEKIDERGRWVKVKLASGEIGWVPMDVFDIPGAPMIPSKETAKTPSGKEEASQPSHSPKASLPVDRPAPGPSKTPREKTSKMMVAKVNVNLRESPSSASKILAVLTKGKQVEKIGQTGQFTKVRVSGGRTGWVASQYLQEVSPPLSAPKADTSKMKEPQKGKMAWITRDQTPLKEKPSNDSKTITVLKKGRQVEKIGKSGSWSKIRLPWGTVGWVPDSGLEKAP